MGLVGMEALMRRIRGNCGPVEYFTFIGHSCFRTATDISERECSKTHALSFTEGFVQSSPERSRRKGRSPFDVRSVLPVRERERRKAPSLRARRSGKRATMSVRAVSAKPENAAGGFFQHSHCGNCIVVPRENMRELQERICLLWCGFNGAIFSERHLT